jgi:hypothetical protein
VNDSVSATRRGRPNLFIVGAPKCGTTALHHYLSQHPDIFFSIAKEHHFFGRDLGYSPAPISLPKYLSYFSSASEKWRGDASPFYLYSVEAARDIKAFAPDARIIVMLRNPVDMMYSLHSQHLFNEREDIEDFEAALAAENDRKHGERIPPQCHFVKGLWYRDVANFAPQVERYFDAFGRDSVKVILYDDFRTRTAEVFADVLRFLGVDESFVPSFEIINANKQLRSRLLRRFYANPPAIFRSLARTLMSHRARYRFINWLRARNAKPSTRPNMPAELRRRLEGEVTPSIRELEQLLDKDLGHWMRSSHQAHVL